MNKWLRWIFTLILIFLLPLTLVCAKDQAQIIGDEITSICYQEHCFQPDIADEAIEWQLGLQGRAELSAEQGMLFVFPRLSSPHFWMKDMLIPIDIIWLNGEGEIVDISHRLPPCEAQADACQTYQPQAAVKYVLEIQAGMAERLDMKVGDQMTFK